MDWVLFVVFGTLAVVAAGGVVISRNPVHSALSLVVTLFCMAVFFVMQQADFLAAVQVIVYAGAIVVLFLFVIMLIGVDRREAIEQDPLKGQRPAAIVLGLVLLGELVFLAHVFTATGARQTRGVVLGNDVPNVERIARSLFTDFLWPFEVTSILLIIGVVGAVVLAKKPQRHGSAAQEDLLS